MMKILPAGSHPLLRGSIKVITLFAVLMLAAVHAFGTDADRQSGMAELKARIPFSKHGDSLALDPNQTASRLVVKFNEGTQVRLRQGQLVSASTDALPASAKVSTKELAIELADLKQRLDSQGLTLKRAFHLSDARLAELKEKGETRSKRQLADLSLFYQIPAKAFKDTTTMKKVCNFLNSLDSVEIAYIEPQAAKLPDAGTPDFTDLQDYKGPAPLGVDADYANTFAGGRGEGISIIDIEAGWNVNHEDLPPMAYTLGLNRTDDGQAVDHGTSSLGVVAAVDNDFGITGIAPNAQVGFSSVWALDKSNRGIEGAILDAINVLGKGDVIFIEHQVGGPDIGDCVCKLDHCNGIAAEYVPLVFSAIQQATALGITVVEAAGNGSVDLDHSVLNNIFDPSVRDSGAIMVGAGQSSQLKPKCFSNHGVRVDVHAWGDYVVTTGYGNLYSGSLGLDDQYRTLWGGTSSATAITAGVVAALQGVAMDTLGSPLSPADVRGLLRATGTPQALGLDHPVGPRSDLRRAIDRLKNDRETPIAAFHVTCDNQANCTYRDISFDFAGEVTSWNWTFDDGATSAAPNPSHTYVSFGNHPVTLTVTDNQDNSDTVTLNTYINAVVCSDDEEVMFKDFEDEQDMEGLTTTGSAYRSNRSGAGYNSDWALALKGTASIEFILDVSQYADYVFNGVARAVGFDTGETLYFEFCPLNADGQCDEEIKVRQDAAIADEEWHDYFVPPWPQIDHGLTRVRVKIGSTANSSISEYAYIDNLQLNAKRCAPAECVNDDWCDSASCNGQARCEAGVCVCGCIVDADCDDNQFCNGAETCDVAKHTCLPGSEPCPGQACNEVDDICGCTSDIDCDDGEFCNGVETCDLTTNTCLSGSNPCSGQPCDEQTDTCSAVDCNSVEDTVTNHVQSGRAYTETQQDCTACAYGCWYPFGCAVDVTTYYCTDAAGQDWNLGTDPHLEITLSSTDQGASWSPRPCITPCTIDGDCPDDGNTCTDEYCDLDTGRCSFVPVSDCCGNETCDSGEDSCNCANDCGAAPATEDGLCADGIDNDCDGYVDGADTADCPGCLDAGESCGSDEECCGTLTCEGWFWNRTCQ